MSVSQPVLIRRQECIDNGNVKEVEIALEKEEEENVHLDLTNEEMEAKLVSR